MEYNCVVAALAVLTGIVCYLAITVEVMKKELEKAKSSLGTLGAEMHDIYGLTGISKPGMRDSGVFIKKEKDGWVSVEGVCIDILCDGERVFRYNAGENHWCMRKEYIKVPYSNCFTTLDAAEKEAEKRNAIIDLQDAIKDLKDSKNKKLTKKK